jgi:hypothetical protein
MTHTNAPITDGFLEGEIALPRINRLDKTYLPSQEWNPPALCAIVETFMRGTIPEFHAHLFLFSYTERNSLVQRRSLLMVYRRKDRGT